MAEVLMESLTGVRMVEPLQRFSLELFIEIVSNLKSCGCYNIASEFENISSTVTQFTYLWLHKQKNQCVAYSRMENVRS